MAHKKGQGSSRNGRESNSQRRGPIADGNAAQRAYLEAITTTEPARRAALHDELVEYCGQDTLAMVELRRALRKKVNRGMAT